MIDLKEERKYRQLRKLGQELHIPMPEAFLTLEVFDKNGRLIQRHHQRSHSWTRNAYNLLLLFMGKRAGNDSTFGAGFLNYKDTGGLVKYYSTVLWQGGYVYSTTNPYPIESAGYGFRGQVATTTNGILVGSGTNAESFEDYALQTLIANGTGAGQLSYVLSELAVASYEAGTKTWTITLVRYMNNNSGGNVSVNEVALNSGEMGGTACYTRDKLGSTVTIPNTGQLKVTYTIQLTYPA